MHCRDVEWSRDNTIRPLASVSVTLLRVVVSDRAHLPQCLNVRFFFKTFFFCKKNFSFQTIQSRPFAALLLPPPTSPFSGIVCFCVFFLQCSHHSCILKSNGEKIIQRAYFSQKKASPISIFLPINLKTLTFRLMKTFPFKGQPANKIVSMFPVTIPNKKVSLQKLRFPAKTRRKNLQKHHFTVDEQIFPPGPIFVFLFL